MASSLFFIPQFPAINPSFPATEPHVSRHHLPLKLRPFRPCAGAVAAPAPAVLEEEEKKRKLYVMNLPWTHSAPDTEKLFGECGTVQKVEIIKRENGEGRGFAFVTMASGEEARAVIEKFDSYELLGRTVRVEFAKSFKKPSPPAPPGATVMETRHQIYASNLAWEVRSTNLRDFFSSKTIPVSARVVFYKQRSAGYGFVSFASEEEAEAAVSELDGKELMGRPLRLRLSQNRGDEVRGEPESTNNNEGNSNDI